MMWSRVAIVGLGLIGGSLGLALRRAAEQRPGLTVVGWDQDETARARAHARGAVDIVVHRLADAVGDAHIVVVAVPVLSVRAVFAAIAPLVQPDTIVTDVSGTKALVCQWASELLPCAFVGGHPMAGSERSGVANARESLFDGATYCLTPLDTMPPAALETISQLVELLGARPQVMEPAAHDRAVAAISHLPFLLSTMLVDVTTRSPEWDLVRSIAATGFRDVSRLASGDPQMHRDVCLTNAAAIRPWLLDTARSLQQLAEELEDGPALQRRFERAKTARDTLIGENKL